MNENLTVKNTYKLCYLDNGSERFVGTENDNVLFIIEKQLKDEKLWRKFVNVFLTKEDSEGNGWRGEYFGKMMRGACLTYRYLPDNELYNILESTVKKLLYTQDEAGRITTYTPESEFNGWDMWCRKYVLVGCLYFYEICKDEKLRCSVLNALTRHADYILSKIGKGKKPVTKTSCIYGGLNSCTILEPIVELYNLTGKKEYLDFAEYIISTGGCETGNLITLVEEGKFPYTFPEVKAYEMMSFFEGILAYYEATGKKQYFDIVEKFMKSVRESDVTIIGSCGCTHELFDNSAIKQTNEVEDGTIMQETCVTVTYMRLNERLLRLTMNAVYADEIEKSAYNALYGSLNILGNKQFCREENALIDGLPFDSYSPLVNQKRGIGIGGYKKFSDGGYYGCCGCIGAAGIALLPLIAVEKTQKGYVFNEYIEGNVTITDNKIAFSINGNGMKDGKVEITLYTEKTVGIEVVLRIPSWSNIAEAFVNGELVPVKIGYNSIIRKWKNGDKIIVRFNPQLSEVRLNDKTAYLYGGWVLSRDERKESAGITNRFIPLKKGGSLIYEKESLCGYESVRLKLKTQEGQILLTDYASCGKHWLEEKSRISVWLNSK